MTLSEESLYISQLFHLVELFILCAPRCATLIDFLFFCFIFLFGRNKLSVINNLSKKRRMKMYCFVEEEFKKTKREKSFFLLYFHPLGCCWKRKKHFGKRKLSCLCFKNYMHAHWHKKIFLRSVNKTRLIYDVLQARFTSNADMLENICLNINFVCFLIRKLKKEECLPHTSSSMRNISSESIFCMDYLWCPSPCCPSSHCTYTVMELFKYVSDENTFTWNIFVFELRLKTMPWASKLWYGKSFWHFWH